jgi:hypothetical protein
MKWKLLRRVHTDQSVQSIAVRCVRLGIGQRRKLGQMVMEINELDIACEEIFYLLECGEWDAYEQVSNRFGIDMVKLYNHYQDLYVKGIDARCSTQ